MENASNNTDDLNNTIKNLDILDIPEPCTSQIGTTVIFKTFIKIGSHTKTQRKSSIYFQIKIIWGFPQSNQTGILKMKCFKIMYESKI